MHINSISIQLKLQIPRLPALNIQKCATQKIHHRFFFSCYGRMNIAILMYDTKITRIQFKCSVLISEELGYVD